MCEGQRNKETKGNTLLGMQRSDHSPLQSLEQGCCVWGHGSTPAAPSAPARRGRTTQGEREGPRAGRSHWTALGSTVCEAGIGQREKKHAEVISPMGRAKWLSFLKGKNPHTVRWGLQPWELDYNCAFAEKTIHSLPWLTTKSIAVLTFEIRCSTLCFLRMFDVVVGAGTWTSLPHRARSPNHTRKKFLQSLQPIRFGELKCHPPPEPNLPRHFPGHFHWRVGSYKKGGTPHNNITHNT